MGCFGRAVLAALVTLTIGCSSAHDGSDQTEMSNSINASGLQAFQAGPYAFFNSQGCVQCHGASQTPKFAQADVSAAYLAAKGTQVGSTAALIDFTNPGASVYVAYAGNNHCGAPPCSNPANSNTILPLLQAWATAETASNNNSQPPPGSGPKFLTATMNLPANLPPITQATPAVLRFDLSKMNPQFAALSGAILEVSIQQLNGTEYRVFNPRVAGNSAAVTFTGIHVYIKPQSQATGYGTEDMNQGDVWVTLTATAATFAKPNPLPAGPIGAQPLSTKANAISARSTADAMTIGFDDLK